jgi:signal peptidase I
MSRQKKEYDRKPYHVNDDISVFYEIKYGKDVIKPGDLIKIKDVRGTFRFIQLAHNINKDVTWIDCINNVTGEYRSFYIEKLKGLIRAKKSIRKKMNA